jgi:hypothetical protein
MHWHPKYASMHFAQQRCQKKVETISISGKALSHPGFNIHGWVVLLSRFVKGICSDEYSMDDPHTTTLHWAG